MTKINRTEHVTSVRQFNSELFIGKILERAGKLSANEVELVLRHQRERGGRFGEVALKLRLVSDADISYALSQQFRYPRLPLGKPQYASELIAAAQPASAEAEALRAIRAQLNFRWFKDGQKQLAIAGINAGDGASTFIANLAISFSQLGKRTLIVDANLRQPTQHRIFNLKNQLGLSDIIAERTSIEEIARLEQFGNLAVLPAGTPPPNPTELISGSSFNQLLDTLAVRFDVIFCDAPAFMTAADAVSISSATGSVMFVARKNKTALSDVRGANQQLIGMNIQVVGSVLLDF